MLFSAPLHWRLHQSWDDVLFAGAAQLQSGGLGQGPRSAGLSRPKRGSDWGQLLVLSSVLAGKEEETNLQTGPAAAAPQVTGSDV